MNQPFTDREIAELYQEAPCGFLITTLDGDICQANRTFAEWIGSDRASFIGKNIRALLSPASQLFYDTHYAALLQVGRVSGVALELAACTSPSLPVLVTSKLKQHGHSSKWYVHSTMFDASERRDRERALVTAKRRADALADVVHSSPHAILTADYDLNILTWNTASILLLGAGVVFVGAPLAQFLTVKVLDALVACLESERPITESVTLSTGMVCRMSAYPMTEGLAVYLIDVTQETRTQQALNEAHDRFTLATKATTDGIWDWNCETGSVYMSGRAQAIIGFRAEAIELPLRQVLRRFHSKSFAVLRTNALQSDDDDGRFETEWRIRHRDGSWRWVQSRGLVLQGPEQRILRVVGSLTDVTERKTEDPLTGLHSRQSLLDHLEWRLSASDLFEAPCALLFVDVDAFKKVNDGLGHAAGNALLIRLAERIRAALRDQPNSIAARIRGDEFAILLESVPDADDACAFAEKVHRSLVDPVLIAGKTVSVSVSIGIALSRPFSGKAEDLLHHADLAMYRAKAAGKGQSVLFNEEMHEAAHKRLTLEADLFQAVRENKLQLFYQPKIELKSGLITGYEALGRWNHPVHGMVSPDLFIAIAEDSHLIRDIGRWTIQEAIRQMARWQASEVVAPTASVSINLSPKQFDDSELIEVVADNLSRYRLSPACVCFEVTEGVLIGDVDTALSVLKRLKALGVGLELDDFGKGYSSLGYLHRYPFDSLKIDRSFVSGLGTQEDSHAIVQTIIALAHTLNLKVIAEGIETQQQEDILRGMGCEVGQGYLFSRALPAKDIEQMSRARARLALSICVDHPALVEARTV